MSSYQRQFAATMLAGQRLANEALPHAGNLKNYLSKRKPLPSRKMIPKSWRVNGTALLASPLRTIAPFMKRYLMGSFPRIGSYGLYAARAKFIENYPERQYRNLRAPHIKNRMHQNWTRNCDGVLNDFESASTAMAAKMPYKEFAFYGYGNKRWNMFKSLNGYRSIYMQKWAERYVQSADFPRYPGFAKSYNMADNIYSFRTMPTLYGRRK